MPPAAIFAAMEHRPLRQHAGSRRQIAEKEPCYDVSEVGFLSARGPILDSFQLRSTASETQSGPKPRATQVGFTLVELLVVVAIVAILIAIVLPAVQAARGAARRTQCQNNLRQIGLALLSHHETVNAFPIGGIEWRSAQKPGNRQLAWSAFLLPYLEQQATYDLLDLSTAFDSHENAIGASAVFPVYVCPSNRRGKQLVDGRGPCDYGGIYGERLTSPNSPPKGSMLYDVAISIDHIKDGASNTLIVAEDSRFADGQWINGRNIFDQAFPINAAPSSENDIRSEHPGGALGVFADASVHFLEETMQNEILAALCTRAGNEVATP